MSHNEIYQMFALQFPDYMVKEWFPNGRNSIRIRQKNEQEFVFTYLSKTDWRFETIDSNIRGLLVKKTLADLAGGTFNDSTNSLTRKIIFGNEKNRKGDTKALC